MRQGKVDFDVCNGHRNKRLTKTCFYLSEHVRRHLLQLVLFSIGRID